jgi:hypothetical protein
MDEKSFFQKAFSRNLGIPAITAAPHYFQFDSFSQTYKKGYMPLGNRNPIQRFKRRWLKKKIDSLGLNFKVN